MSDHALVLAKEENEKLSHRLKRWRDESAEVTKTAIGTVVSAGAAYLVGYIQGRYPDKAKVFGHNVSGIVSALGLVASMTGALGKESYIAHDIGLTTGGKFLGDHGEQAGKDALAEAA